VKFADETYVRSIAGLSRQELGERMKETEREQGFTIVTDAPWLDWDDWSPFTIISQDGGRVRLVALEAKRPGKGAFTRLVERISRARLTPVLVEPSQLLTDWAVRHDWRRRRIGKGRFAHEIWYPRLRLF
jgi:hypothetical protein